MIRYFISHHIIYPVTVIFYYIAHCHYHYDCDISHWPIATSCHMLLFYLFSCSQLVSQCQKFIYRYVHQSLLTDSWQLSTRMLLLRFQSGCGPAADDAARGRDTLLWYLGLISLLPPQPAHWPHCNRHRHDSNSIGYIYHNTCIHTSLFLKIPVWQHECSIKTLRHRKRKMCTQIQINTDNKPNYN